MREQPKKPGFFTNVVVQFDEGIEFPFFLVNSNEVLLDTVKSQLLILDENSCWLSHESFGHFENFGWHCC